MAMHECICVPLGGCLLLYCLSVCVYICGGLDPKTKFAHLCNSCKRSKRRIRSASPLASILLPQIGQGKLTPTELKALNLQS